MRKRGEKNEFEGRLGSAIRKWVIVAARCVIRGSLPNTVGGINGHGFAPLLKIWECVGNMRKRRGRVSRKERIEVGAREKEKKRVRDNAGGRGWKGWVARGKELYEGKGINEWGMNGKDFCLWRAFGISLCLFRGRRRRHSFALEEEREGGKGAKDYFSISKLPNGASDGLMDQRGREYIGRMCRRRESGKVYIYTED